MKRWSKLFPVGNEQSKKALLFEEAERRRQKDNRITADVKDSFFATLVRVIRSRCGTRESNMLLSRYTLYDQVNKCIIFTG